jgi:hypothetical protein
MSHEIRTPMNGKNLSFCPIHLPPVTGREPENCSRPSLSPARKPLANSV